MRLPGTDCRRPGIRASTRRTIEDHPQEPGGAPKPPIPRARSAAEARFLDLGPGAHAWLIAASAAGTVRIRAKMTAAVELAAFVGADTVDAALAVAAEAGRFAESDLPAIVAHHADAPSSGNVVADESHSVQPGTGAWAGFGTTAAGTGS